MKIMEAKELRIGNYFTDKSRKPLQLKRISFEEDDISFCLVYGNEVNGYYVWDKEAEPIPLSEEWLLKFGFKKRKGSQSIVFHKEGFPFFIDFSQGIFSKCYNNEYDNGEIKYVHQLQNLYFALTGAELILINP